MNNSVTKAAIKFRRKIKKQVDFESISAYLRKNGYAIVFYHPETGHKLLDELDLADYAQKTSAFTLQGDSNRFIFIKSDVPPEDKLYLLLHEAGHIMLNHLNSNVLTVNTRLQDVEADTFAHTVLNPPKHNYIITALSALVTALLLGTVFLHFQTPKTTSPTTPVEYVLITPTGEKYHRETCRYVQGKNCTQLTEAEAQKNYDPCSICNP